MIIPALVAALLAAAPAAAAQTGARLPTASDYTSGQAFSAAPGAGEIQGVDLRRYMPPVGEQSMNDCTAWAAAAAKSCLEAIDQGWRPTRPQTIFSPAFIYPQINGGEDDGSSLINAALLLEKAGAATLKTTPYRPGDYKTQPPEFAFQEAQRFRNRTTYLLENREQIKLALRENLPVLVGCRLTPAFFSGKYDSYTAVMHRKSMKRRRPDQPHAMHAMVIAGYDEPTQRFLFRNSWGEDWGHGGYCWVDYDLFDEIDPSETSETFVFLALAMEDQLLDVEATPDVGEDLKKAVSLAVRGQPDGYDRRAEATRYRFTAELRAPQEALEQVVQVDWTVPTSVGDTQTLESADAARAFRVVSAVGGEEHEIRADVTFGDGETRAMSTTTAFEPPTADDRLIDFYSDDFYYGREPIPGVRAPRSEWPHVWTRVIYFKGSLQDIRDVEKVILDDGETVEDVTPGGRFSSIGPFYHRTSEPRPLEAQFTFADGSQMTKRWVVEEFEDPATDDIWMNHELKPVGDGEQTAFRMSVRIPVLIGYEVDDVTWQFDGSQDHWTHEKNVSEWAGYPVDGLATRDFRVRATIEFFTERETVVLEEWIELPDEGTAYDTPLRLELFDDSSYRGRNQDDERTWEFNLRVSGDWEHTEGVRGVHFTIEDVATGETATGDGGRDDHGDWRIRHVAVGREIRVTAEIEHVEGDMTLERVFASPAPAVDGIFLDTRTDYLWKDDVRWYARLGGSGWHQSAYEVAYVHQMDYAEAPYDPHRDWAFDRHPRPWMTVLRREDGTRQARALVHRTTHGPDEVEARVHYNDGSMEILRRETSAEVCEWIGPPRKPLHVQFRERWMGPGTNHDALPFRGEGVLQVDEEFGDGLDHVLVCDEALGWSRASRFEPGDEFSIRYEDPGAMLVRAVYEDGRFEDQRVPFTCLAPRHHELELVRHAGAVLPRGPGRLLDRIAKVVYHVTPQGGESQVVQGKNFKYGFGRNALYWKGTEPLDVRAEITFDDDSSRTLEAHLALPGDPGLQIFTEDRFWGWVQPQNFDEPRPYWLVTHRFLHAAYNDDGSPGQKLNHSHGGGFPVFTWPDFVVHAIHHETDRQRFSIDFWDGSYVRITGDDLHEYELDDPILESGLQLDVHRTWENPDPSPEARDEWVFRLRGPLQDLYWVESVDYALRFTRGGRNLIVDWPETSRHSPDGDGFRGVFYPGKWRSITATVHFHGGERAPQVLKWEPESDSD